MTCLRKELGTTYKFTLYTNCVFHNQDFVDLLTEREKEKVEHF